MAFLALWTWIITLISLCPVNSLFLYHKHKDNSCQTPISKLCSSYLRFQESLTHRLLLDTFRITNFSTWHGFKPILAYFIFKSLQCSQELPKLAMKTTEDASHKGLQVGSVSSRPVNPVESFNFEFAVGLINYNYPGFDFDAVLRASMDFLCDHSEEYHVRFSLNDYKRDIFLLLHDFLSNNKLWVKGITTVEEMKDFLWFYVMKSLRFELCEKPVKGPPEKGVSFLEKSMMDLPSVTWENDFPLVDNVHAWVLHLLNEYSILDALVAFHPDSFRHAIVDCYPTIAHVDPSCLSGQGLYSSILRRLAACFLHHIDKRMENLEYKRYLFLVDFIQLRCISDCRVYSSCISSVLIQHHFLDISETEALSLTFTSVLAYFDSQGNFVNHINVSGLASKNIYLVCLLPRPILRKNVLDRTVKFRAQICAYDNSFRILETCLTVLPNAQLNSIALTPDDEFIEIWRTGYMQKFESRCKDFHSLISRVFAYLGMENFFLRLSVEDAIFIVVDHLSKASSTSLDSSRISLLLFLYSFNRLASLPEISNLLPLLVTPSTRDLFSSSLLCAALTDEMLLSDETLRMSFLDIVFGNVFYKASLAYYDCRRRRPKPSKVCERLAAATFIQHLPCDISDPKYLKHILDVLPVGF